MSAPGTNPEHPVEERIRLKTKEDAGKIIDYMGNLENLTIGKQNEFYLNFLNDGMPLFKLLQDGNRDFISYYRDKTKQWGKYAALSRFIAGQLVIKLSEGATLLSKIVADSSDENKMAVHAYMELLTAFLIKHELAEVVKEDATDGQ